MVTVQIVRCVCVCVCYLTEICVEKKNRCENKTLTHTSMIIVIENKCDMYIKYGGLAFTLIRFREIFTATLCLPPFEWRTRDGIEKAEPFSSTNHICLLLELNTLSHYKASSILIQIYGEIAHFSALPSRLKRAVCVIWPVGGKSFITKYTLKTVVQRYNLVREAKCDFPFSLSACVPIGEGGNEAQVNFW